MCLLNEARYRRLIPRPRYDSRVATKKYDRRTRYVLKWYTLSHLGRPHSPCRLLETKIYKLKRR